MKVFLKSTLKNITEKESITDKTIAIKEKNKLTYQTKDFNYILKIISPQKIILNRNNNDIDCTMYFEQDKKTLSFYQIKKEGYNIEIEIKTTKVKINENNIEVHYKVIDSNTHYELKIEMSEKNEHKKRTI